MPNRGGAKALKGIALGYEGGNGGDINYVLAKKIVPTHKEKYKSDIQLSKGPALKNKNYSKQINNYQYFNLMLLMQLLFSHTKGNKIYIKLL
jgi:hypothetical protein